MQSVISLLPEEHDEIISMSLHPKEKKLFLITYENMANILFKILHILLFYPVHIVLWSKQIKMSFFPLNIWEQETAWAGIISWGYVKHWLEIPRKLSSKSI